MGIACFVKDSNMRYCSKTFIGCLKCVRPFVHVLRLSDALHVYLRITPTRHLFSFSSYFIRIYDVTKSQKVWEQELYNNFNYVANMKPFFHFFEADEGFAGLNFASDQEATKFKGLGVGVIC